MLVTIALENFNRIERWEDGRLTLTGGRKLSGALDPLKIYYQERQEGDAKTLECGDESPHSKGLLVDLVE
jgi:hypothetical protein